MSGGTLAPPRTPRLQLVAALWMTAAMVCACLLTSCTSTPDARGKSGNPVVMTDAGAIEGVERDSMHEFLGIPYAQAPVGELRWRAPRRATSWTGVRRAKAFGAACAQGKRLGDFADPSSAEDCLFLNVHAPARAHPTPRPVIVWIHGGGLFAGQSQHYDPRWLVVDGGVVFVSLNYRLNVFGFMHHPTLIPKGESGNFALLDQQLAMDWVRRNIARFGGDPGNVTLMGESSGAYSAQLHMISPSSWPLFQKAIIQSGYAYRAWPFVSRAVAEQRAEKLAAAVGCDPKDAACLRSASTSSILAAEAETFTAPGPIADTVLPLSMKDAIQSGRFSKTPILMGTNLDEMRWQVALQEQTSGKPVSVPALQERVRSLFGINADRVLANYPVAEGSSAGERLGNLLGDWFYSCDSRAFALDVAAVTKAYFYEFADQGAPALQKSSFPLGAYHTAELQYLFPRYRAAYKIAPRPLDEQQSRLARRMVAYWSSFARSGVPSSPDGPPWPAFDQDEQVLQLSTTSSVSRRDFGARHQCKLWDGIYPSQ